MSLASVAAQQNNAIAAANTAASGISAATPAAGSAASGKAAASSANPLGSLSGNFNDFLKLLMTQLQNQDPTSPLDTNQFTSQLVQFASVEQQINTNTSMTQLIQLTQGGELIQASSMVGKQVAVQSDHLPLQNGRAAVTFTAPADEAAAVAIYSDAGAKIRDAALTASKGQNSWKWDGTDNNGRSVPDGSYRIAVIGVNSAGTAAALPFDVVGTATGVQKQGNAVQIQLGPLSADFTAIQNVGAQ